jgi:hypothetical protein
MPFIARIVDIVGSGRFSSQLGGFRRCQAGGPGYGKCLRLFSLLAFGTADVGFPAPDILPVMIIYAGGDLWNQVRPYSGG